MFASVEKCVEGHVTLSCLWHRHSWHRKSWGLVIWGTLNPPPPGADITWERHWNRQTAPATGLTCEGRDWDIPAGCSAEVHSAMACLQVPGCSLS